MGKPDVKKIESDLRNAKIDPAGLRWADPREKPFEVLGFYWFESEKRFRRFPAEAEKMNFRQGVLDHAACTAGGQLRFRTDSRRIVLWVRSVKIADSTSMSETGRSGFDLYTGELGQEIFWDSAPPACGKKEYVREIFHPAESTMREFRLNFPLYNGVEELWIGLEKKAKLLPPEPLPVKRPVVIYGTSITQGGSATRPGSAFTNQLSRRLQVEFLNFGFSGNGQNEPEAAELLAGIEDPAMIIIDSEANSVSAQLVLERVPRFLEILREKHPLVPIVVVTKVPYGPRYACEIPVFKEEFRTVYKARKKAGDKNIYFVDGTKFWAPKDYTENTIDGAHPTDLGFTRMADKLEPVLRRLLEKYGYAPGKKA